MDIVGGVRLVDGTEAKIVSGVDDHSRFCISAQVVPRATARPTCEALALAMRRHGVPAEILTDNGKVFTGRFGPGTGEVLFDRICRENGIKHLLDRAAVADDDGQGRAVAPDAAPEFLTGKVFADRSRTPRRSSTGGSSTTTTTGPTRASGWSRPWERFRLAAADAGDDRARGRRSRHHRRRRAGRHAEGRAQRADQLRVGLLQGRGVARRGDRRGHLRWPAACTSTTAGCSSRPTPADTSPPMRPRPDRRGQRTHDPPAPQHRGQRRQSASVTRKVDSSGNVSFAGTSYRVGNKFRRRQVQVAVVAGTVEISHRRGTHPHPPGPPRPHPRTRRPRQPRRPTPQDQRRLNPPPTWNTTTGATPSHGYRTLTTAEIVSRVSAR